MSKTDRPNTFKISTRFERRRLVAAEQLRQVFPAAQQTTALQQTRLSPFAGTCPAHSHLGMSTRQHNAERLQSSRVRRPARHRYIGDQPASTSGAPSRSSPLTGAAADAQPVQRRRRRRQQRQPIGGVHRRPGGVCRRQRQGVGGRRRRQEQRYSTGGRHRTGRNS